MKRIIVLINHLIQHVYVLFAVKYLNIVSFIVRFHLNDKIDLSASNWVERWRTDPSSISLPNLKLTGQFIQKL